MRKRTFFHLFFGLLLSLSFSTASFPVTRGIQVTPREGQRLYLYRDYYALVVGVSDYQYWPDLPNAVKDAAEVASHLEKIGFEVRLILDPNFENLKKALSDLVYETGNEYDRALLFYFAGHGETLELADGNKLGFIVPSDCPLKNSDPVGFDSKAVSMKDVEVLALKVKSKHLIMLFDSCFSGSLFNMVRAAPVDISEKSASPVRQFITAGAAGEQVPDQSVFKVVFLQGVSGDADLNNDGYVTGAELGMHLQQEVVNYTRGGQHPQYGKINNPKLDRGDFIFVPRKAAATEGVQGKTAAASRTSAPKQTQDVRLAYIPQTATTPVEGLRSGHGPFIIDDFEDKDLRSKSLNASWKYRVKGPARLNLDVDSSQGANETSGSMKITYELGADSAVSIRLGGVANEREREVEKDPSAAYDLSRFNKISFYLKGEKVRATASAPNKILAAVVCYNEKIKSNQGKFATYYNRIEIVPDPEWKKIEIPFDDFSPSAWTRRNATGYPPAPDWRNTLTLFFMFSSFKGDGGSPGSNTVWIDEIILQ